MSRPACSRLLVLLILAFFACVPTVHAEPGRGDSVADSLLKVYCRQIKAQLNTPEGLLMCDTLCAIAAARGWLHLQAVALCL